MALIAYIAHFVAVDSKNVITNAHNRRLQSMAEKVVRGKIISSDGKVLAQTLTENGSEIRDYPYGRMFAHVVGYNDKGKSGLESVCNFDLENWTELNTSKNSLLLNRATQGLYPPGSTFKVVTALEYMREHKNTYKNFKYHCTGYTTVGTLKIHCYGGEAHGTVNLEQAIEKSCNCAFVHMSEEINKGKLASLAGDLMYNSKVPINLLANSSRFVLDKKSGTNEMAHTSIGQGQTLITPLENAMVMSAIANDGVVMQPYLVENVKNIDGGVIKETKASKLSEPLEASECETLKKMLRKVVTKGTGTRAYSSHYNVYGKTGSAEYNSAKDSHAWFIGCAERGGKKIVVSVLVEGGDSGGRVAAPIADKVFHAFLD